MHLDDKRGLRGENNEHHPLKSLRSFSVPTPNPTTTLYIEPDLYEALQRRAKEERRSISNLCNILIEDAMQVWLDANPPEPKDPTTAVKPAAKSAAAKAKEGKGKS